MSSSSVAAAEAGLSSFIAPGGGDLEFLLVGLAFSAGRGLVLCALLNLVVSS